MNKLVKHKFVQMKCPMCNTFLNTTYECIQQDFNTTIEEKEYNLTLYKPQCPRCRKKITFQESDYHNKTISWMEMVENSLDKYLIKGNPNQYNFDAMLVNTFHPNNDDIKTNTLWQNLIEQNGEICAVIPETQNYMVEKYKKHCKKIWLIPDTFFQTTIGTMLPNILIELNLLQEKDKYFKSVLLSFYETWNDDFINLLKK